jgi:peptidyl-prolyl cis-trans isomerase C
VSSPARIALAAFAALAALRHLAGNRLVQFLVLGGALFAASPRSPDELQIALDGQRLEALALREAARQGKPVADEALRRQVRTQVIEDEILVREARRLGLDQDDLILRRRLIQKALFLAEDLGGASRMLDDHELAAYFAAHRQDYRIPARMQFRHVFGADPIQLAQLEAEVASYSAQHPGEVPPLGQPLPVDRRVDADQARVEREFGADFFAALTRLPVGQWSAPLRSTLGFHLVVVDQAVPAHLASFPEVADQVRLDAMTARRQLAVSAFFAQAVRRYRVEIDGRPAALPSVTTRTAAHFAPSMED